MALARRMVDELVEPAELLDSAVTAARTLAALSPPAVAATKQQLRQPARERPERDGARIDAAATEIWASPETLARAKDYVARTFKKA